ncbi:MULTISPECIES: preprotein translocase subunit SecG [Thermodesulfobacterium]|jgi:preprotein translocase subunit SecG|uniref:Protein-export membrane protein SecG n=1 Tax=Thermodesulfobacterium commune TaxID=1741 RepID=A0A101FK43_9BACT|nr:MULTISPECIES: preprotein translocase subunit SecG [Thermodesulfobacterium]KUJ97203.1 MAG: Preprotein translocase, SecG subunit [Thermodesulfobacterium sp. 37_54]KUK18851.1 MAG: Preprotein translocase, SecG subunit [Thermodesulfobacterium commune]KUK38502.1 MAG: Preprotein translocase, SecG subunit [Thermodesulfobacterium commune]MBZ4682377.1 secG [Thermodesulfobacterium sp.]MDK2861682.1 preprotein translocase subunit SecG [Thermodesulfobacterium sp.]
METILTVLQLIVAILIILIVLINVTKGSEYGAVFRGAEAIFGGAGPTSFLNKVTMILVLVFFLNSILLTKIHTSKNKTEIPVVPTPQTQTPSPSSIPTPTTPQNIPVPPQIPSSTSEKPKN